MWSQFQAYIGFYFPFLIHHIAIPLNPFLIIHIRFNRYWLFTSASSFGASIFGVYVALIVAQRSVVCGVVCGVFAAFSEFWFNIPLK
jgi:hypothetical protein